MLICILAPSLCFTPELSNAAFLLKKPPFKKNIASVALNLVVTVIGRLVARSGRKRGKRRTDRQTDGMTKQLL